MAVIRYHVKGGGIEEITDYEVFSYIRSDFFNNQINRSYVRGLLGDMGFTLCEIFGLCELLGLEKEKFIKEGEEHNVSYI